MVEDDAPARKELLYGFEVFCILKRLLAKASCFFFSISAAEHFPVVWLVTKTRRKEKTNNNKKKKILLFE